jgi:S1-C subfamily serine protease
MTNHTFKHLQIDLNFCTKNLFFLILSTFFVTNVSAEQVLPSTVKKIKPSIVAVGTFMPKRASKWIALGTGFAVKPNLIVTNAHVIPAALDVENLEQVAVTFRQNEDVLKVAAKVVAEDKDHDLALLKIEQPVLIPLKLGNAASVQEGQLYAYTGLPIGMVLGFYPVTHRGIVSTITPNVIPTIRSRQLNEKLVKRLKEPYDVFQLDATAYPGNSGSPLYDVDTGEVVGIIDKVFVQESKENVLSTPSGISYAIPVNFIEKLLKDNPNY